MDKYQQAVSPCDSNLVRQVVLIKIKDFVAKSKLFKYTDNEDNIFLLTNRNDFKKIKKEPLIIEDNFLNFNNNIYNKIKLNEKHVNFNIFIKPTAKKLNKVIESLKEIFEKCPFHFMKHVINVNIFLNSMTFNHDFLPREDVKIDLDSILYFKVYYMFSQHFYIYSKLDLKKQSIVIIDKTGKILNKSIEFSIIDEFVKKIFQRISLKHPVLSQIDYYGKNLANFEEGLNLKMSEENFTHQISRENYIKLKEFITDLSLNCTLLQKNSTDDFNFEIFLYKTIILDNKFECKIHKIYHLAKIKDYTSIFLSNIGTYKLFSNFCETNKDILKYVYINGKEVYHIIKKLITTYNKELKNISINNSSFSLKKITNYNVGYKRKLYKIKNLKEVTNHYSLHSDQEIIEPYINIFSALQDFQAKNELVRKYFLINFKPNTSRSKKFVSRDFILNDVDENVIVFEFKKGIVYLFLFMMSDDNNQFYALYDYLPIVKSYRLKYPNLKCVVLHYDPDGHENEEFKSILKENLIEIYFIISVEALHRLLRYIYPSFTYSPFFHYFIVDAEGIITDIHLKDYSIMGEKIDHFYNKKVELSQKEYILFKHYSRHELLYFDYAKLGIQYRPGVLVSLQKRCVMDENSNITSKRFFARCSIYLKEQDLDLLKFFQVKFKGFLDFNRDFTIIDYIYPTYTI